VLYDLPQWRDRHASISKWTPQINWEFNNSPAHGSAQQAQNYLRHLFGLCQDRRDDLLQDLLAHQYRGSGTAIAAYASFLRVLIPAMA